MPEQDFPPRRPAGFRRPGPGVPPDYQDEDPAPWAGLPPVRPARPASDDPMGPDALPQDEPVPDLPRAPGGRARRKAARRRRRWAVMIAALVVVAGGVIAAIVVPGGPAPAPVTPDGLITTFQPGELQTVPAACGTVPAATVQSYLPGHVKQASPLPIDGSAESACDWTIDRAPVYRLLELNLLAYAPSGLASGDGSATYAAIDAYTQTLQNLQNPPKHSAEPRATTVMLSGLGNEAFTATQVFSRGGAVTDVATVVVRYHNVVVTVTLDGLQHSNRGNYGPVSLPSLSSAALAFAQAAEAALH